MKIMGVLSAIFFLSTPTLLFGTYILDTLYVPIRSGTEGEQQVVKTLKSGDKVEVLDTKNEFSKVKTATGEEGWLRSRYLQNTPAAKDRLAELEARLATYEGDNSPNTQDSIGTLRQEITKLTSTNDSLKAQNHKLSEEISRITKLSSEAIDIDTRNQQLIQEKESIEKKLAALTTENIRLADNSRNEGIKLGIGAIFLGILAGLALPFLRSAPRRERYGVKLR